MEKGYPLIIVMYLDREMMMNPDIIKPFAESLNDALTQRQANAMAFFLPTDGEERIECINPVQVDEADMDKIKLSQLSPTLTVPPLFLCPERPGSSSSKLASISAVIFYIPFLSY